MNNPTREQMIQKLVQSIEDWDLDILIEICQQYREEELKKLPLKDIQEVYDVEISSKE